MENETETFPHPQLGSKKFSLSANAETYANATVAISTDTVAMRETQNPIQARCRLDPADNGSPDFFTRLLF